MPKRGRNDTEGPPLDEGGVNMAFPMQDTVVSSTVTNVHSPFYTIENNFQCETIQKLSRGKYKKARIRKMSNCKSISSDNCESWLSDYSEVINRLTGSTNYEYFQRFLAVYAKNVAKDAFTWKSELSRLDTLRKHISNVLLYYHFHWFKWKEKVSDNYFYLQKMSDILVIYVNLELRFFNKNIISECKMSNILLHKICIYLDYSEEHIFKVLFKSKLLTKQHKNIFLPIIEKCFLNVKMKEEDITEIMYIRYILALKLWKSMNDDKEEDNKVKHLALTILGSDMSQWNFKHLDFFPQAPDQFINKPVWYLQTKSFDLETLIECYLKYTEHSHQSTISNSLKMIEECENCYHIQIKEKVSPTKNQNQNLLRRRKLKPGQILVIDLTTDEQQEKIIGEATEDEDHSNIEKNVRKKIKWLEYIIGNRNFLKSLKHNVKITINADSTDNMENKNETVSVNLPISDNEVTESSKIDSNSESCDNSRSNNIPTLSDSNDVIQNSDTTKDKENQNSEISNPCVKCSSLFNNCICEIINSNILSNIELPDLSGAKLLPSDLHIEITQEAVPSLINFDPNSMELFSSEFSFSEKDVINPRLTKKYSPTRSDKPYNSLHCKDSLLASSCGSTKNQLLTEISEFGLCEIENKDSVIPIEESLITSTEPPLNPLILRLNSDTTMSDFSKIPFAENLISEDNEGENYIGNIIKSDEIQLKNLEDIKIQPELGENIFQDLESSTEVKKHSGRKRVSTTLKIKEPPTQKIKVPELFGLNDNNDDNLANTSCSKQESKSKDETPTMVSGSVDKSGKNLSSQFLAENIPLENQQPKETPTITNLQTLADCIKSNNHNKIITMFDPESSMLKQLTSKKIQPSSCHYFIRLLYEKGLLLQHYTGNRGDLEKQIGIAQEKFTVLPDNFPDSFSFQSNCHFSLATLLIFFTNSLASISKWLKDKYPRLFVIQETTVEVENMFIVDYLKLIPNRPTGLKLKESTRTQTFEVIRTETLEKGCKLLIEKLGWTEEAKEYEKKPLKQ